MLKSYTGISLTPQKKNLVVSRLARRLSELDLEDFTSYINYLSKSEQERQFFIDKMTTNETYFLREEVHFEYLKNLILANPTKAFRIWSCASSNGSEAYTVSIFLKEFSKLNTHKILASDISEEILEKAVEGVFLEDDLRKLSTAIKNKYFFKGKDHWRIADQIKEAVSFKQINLMWDVYPLKSPVDIIFCRNVMIYFDEATREELLIKIHNNLNPGGLLFLGLSESIVNNNYYIPLGNSIFQRKDSANGSVNVEDTFKDVKKTTFISAVRKDVPLTPANAHKIIAIGASTGGTVALTKILSNLSNTLPGIVIVQHMPPAFIKTFSERLNSESQLIVTEGKHGDLVKPGHCYLAPGGKQTEIIDSVEGFVLQVKEAPPVDRHCPSVNVLFSSVAKHAKKNSLGIILTGMGDDGARGLLEMKKNGAATIAQDEKSCTVFGMPRVAIEMGAADKILSLDEIIKELRR